MRARRAAVVALVLVWLPHVTPSGERETGSVTPAVTLPFGPPGSSLTFTIHRPGETIEGTAREFSGTVTFDPADPGAGGSVVLRVAAASLETGNRLRDRKMRAAHLEVERFPEIVFRSTAIEAGTEGRRSAPPARPPGAPCPPPGGGTRRVLAEGTLALHGVTRSLYVPASIRYDNGSFSAEGCVDLTYGDYDIPVPRFLWLVMDDDIQVRFRLVAGAGNR